MVSIVPPPIGWPYDEIRENSNRDWNPCKADWDPVYTPHGTPNPTATIPGILAADKQVGGDHYKQYPIQPYEYNQRNGLRYLEGNVVKYVTRHRNKHGKEDLLKALHCIELLIELEYKND